MSRKYLTNERIYAIILTRVQYKAHIYYLMPNACDKENNMPNNNIKAMTPEEQVYEEMLELGAKIEQAQQQVESFTNEVKMLNVHFAELRKEWDEMSARHKEIYKPRDISDILKRAGIDPNGDTEK